MPRAGKLLEQLVTALERALSGPNITITSPDYILGKNSGTRREVDVSVRSQVGSTSILVILECRDRTGVENVTWIEQLASKQQDVGASKAIAVSSSGFTSGARNTAARLGIDLRLIDEISIGDMTSWLLPTQLEFQIQHCQVQHVHFQLALKPQDVPKLDSYFTSVKDVATDPVSLYIKATGETVQPAELGRYITESNPDLFKDIPQDGTTHTKQFRIGYPDENARIALVTPEGTFDILELLITVQLKIEFHDNVLSAVTRYTDEDHRLLAEGLHVSLRSADDQIQVTMFIVDPHDSCSQ